MRRWQCIFTAVIASLFSLPHAKPIAAPVVIWTAPDVRIALERSGLVDVQSLMRRTQEKGVLWIQDRYLTTHNAGDRYPHILSDEAFRSRLAGRFFAGRNLYTTPSQLPPVLQVSDLQGLDGVPAGQVAFLDVTAAAHGLTTPEDLLRSALDKAPIVVLSGTLTKDDADEIAAVQARRLQSTATDGLNLQPQDLPAIFYMVVFIGVAALGLTMLHSVDAPVAFEDKLLQINKEY